MKLTKYEQELSDYIENNDIKPSPIKDELMEKLQQAAKNTLKDKSISIRINSRDLDKLKQKSRQKAIPYQTLITSLVHQYVNEEIEVKM